MQVILNSAREIKHKNKLCKYLNNLCQEVQNVSIPLVSGFLISVSHNNMHGSL